MRVSVETNFGKLASFRNGLNFNNDNRGFGCKIIGVSDFGDKLTPDYDSLDEIDPTGIIKEDDYLQNGDILFVRSNGNKNLVGRSMYINNVNEKIVFSGFCIRARITSQSVNPLFYAYFFKTKLFRKIISSIAGGANIQNLNQGLLDRAIVPMPSIEIQNKITSILSAYDDLIENNLKQIKLLEEIAQRTYEEWFVKFRVNGEQLPIDEKTGLPVGWTIINLNELYQIKYGKNLPQTLIKENGVYPVYGASGKMGYYEQYNSDDKVVLITSRGNGSGDIHRTYERAFVTNNSFIVEPKMNYSYLKISYTLNFLKTINLKGYCSGSAQPQLTNAAMDNINVVLPSRESIENYNDLVEINVTQADNLRIQNQKLKESRDILLPKLMNGTINVEKDD